MEFQKKVQFQKKTPQKPINPYGERRAGDPDELVADSTKASEILVWKAQNDLEHIITNAWKWHQKSSKKLRMII